MSNSKFYSKILLFGEYSVIKGGRGLAFPCQKFFGELRFGEAALGPCFKLDDLAEYLDDRGIIKEKMDTKKFKEDVKNHLFFDSNIPFGHGIGSSGALCAAIYEKYSYSFKRKENYSADELSTLQDIMALMESFYHGTSSGLDCLISLIDRPVLVASRSRLQIYDGPGLEEFGYFSLFETGINRKTSPLVYSFLEELKRSSVFQEKFEQFKSYSDEIIQTMESCSIGKFNEYFEKISKLQLLFFTNMIPDTVKQFWAKGLETGEYFVKLCGAGGGGFFLVYSREQKLVQNNLIALNY